MLAHYDAAASISSASGRCRLQAQLLQSGGKQISTSLSSSPTSRGGTGASTVRYSFGASQSQGIAYMQKDCLFHAAQADEDGWDIYWASVITVKQIFSPENSVRLEPHQIINHFPNHYELTRKVTHIAVTLQAAIIAQSV